MAEFDHGIKMIAETTGRQLARLAGVVCRQWQAAESTVQVSLEKLADRVFLARQGRQRFVVYFEFYTTWDRNAPWDMLAKSGLLSQRERLPTVCIAVVLRQRGFRSPGGQLRLEAAGNPTQQLWFKEVCLWRLKPEAWWEDEPGLMALYPLCQHGQQPRDAITHAAAAIERKVTGEVEKADALYLLHRFGGLAYSRLDVAAIIGRDKMKASKFEKELVAQGRLEGQLAARRSDILAILEGRFGDTVRGAFEARLNSIEDFDQLGRLLRLVGMGASLDEFRAAVP